MKTKTKYILVKFTYLDKLRLYNKQKIFRFTNENEFDFIKKNLKAHTFERVLEKYYPFYSVVILEYEEVKYKWWEFWK